MYGLWYIWARVCAQLWQKKNACCVCLFVCFAIFDPCSCLWSTKISVLFQVYFRCSYTKIWQVFIQRKISVSFGAANTHSVQVHNIKISAVINTGSILSLCGLHPLSPLPSQPLSLSYLGNNVSRELIISVQWSERTWLDSVSRLYYGFPPPWSSKWSFQQKRDRFPKARNYCSGSRFRT